MTDRLPIVLYGATGYTGTLIAHALQRRGVRFAIAGRDAGKLGALQRDLQSTPEVLVASTEDRAGLERMASRGRVVLSCAGPFIDHGPPVQEAALASGAHFLDISGEARYLRDTWQQRDGRAREKGLAIVNAVGFDVVASELPSWYACRGLGAVECLEIAIAAGGGGFSQGTRRSALRQALETSLGFEHGEYIEVPPGRFRRKIDFPEPVGTAWGMSVPWGDIGTAPRATGARTVRVYFKVPAPAAFVLPMLAPLARIARLKPIYNRAQKRIAEGPTGPDEAARARSRFMIWAEATGADGRKKRAVMSGPGGYDFTAFSAAECAIRAADPAFDRRGVLTPTQAFDAASLRETFEPNGVRLSEEG